MKNLSYTGSWLIIPNIFPVKLGSLTHEKKPFIVLSINVM